MTYDLTNQATLKNWTTQLTLADIGWGTVLGADFRDCSFLDHFKAYRLTAQSRLQPDQRLQQTADHAVQFQVALHRHQADAVLG